MNPHSYEILNNLGLCLLNLGQVDRSIQLLTEAVKENYEFPRALNNLGNAYRKKGMIPQAISHNEQAVKVNMYL
jgi:tetratricopeptide (TPR) repeat protein